MASAAPFDLVIATSVDEAVAALTTDPSARVLAGGQSLLPLMATRSARPGLLVDVNGTGLDGVTADPATGLLRLGATVRHRTVERDPTVARWAPLLAAAAAWVGHPPIRHRGTLGGSLAHADPAAELPAAVVALGGEVVVRGPAGTRRLAAADLVAAPFVTVLAPDDVVVEVTVPLAGDRPGAAFCEWAPRHRDRAEAGVGLAVEAGPDGTCTRARGATCGVTPRPVDLTDVLDDALLGVTAAAPLPDALVRHVAGAVTGVCREHGAGADGADLAGALAARAATRALRRAAAPGADGRAAGA
jgi:carbon-monoxide dehydrogenase medium subunit